MGHDNGLYDVSTALSGPATLSPSPLPRHAGLTGGRRGDSMTATRVPRGEGGCILAGWPRDAHQRGAIHRLLVIAGASAPHSCVSRCCTARAAYPTLPPGTQCVHANPRHGPKRFCSRRRSASIAAVCSEWYVYLFFKHLRNPTRRKNETRRRTVDFSSNSRTRKRNCTCQMLTIGLTNSQGCASRDESDGQMGIINAFLTSEPII